MKKDDRTKLIDFVFGYFVENSEWPSTGKVAVAMHDEVDDVDSLFHNLGMDRIIGYGSDGNSTMDCDLSVLGISQSTSPKKEEEINRLIAAVKVFVDIYIKKMTDNEEPTITTSDLAKELNINEKESKRLNLMISGEGNFNTGGTASGDQWEWKIPRKVLRFKNVKTIDDYFKVQEIFDAYGYNYEIDGSQISMTLNHAFDYFLKHNSWPTIDSASFALHEKLVVDDVVSVIEEGLLSKDSRYLALTVKGIDRVEHPGRENELKNFIGAVYELCKAYKDNPEREEITLDEIAGKMNIDENEKIRLGRLLFEENNIYEHGGSSPDGTRGTYVLERKILRFDKVKNVRDYLLVQEQLDREYRESLAFPDMPQEDDGSGETNELNAIKRGSYDEAPPKVFISYSWETKETPGHKAWVKDLSSRLRGDGIDVILDKWETVPGDQLPHFMERSVRTSDHVVIICTPIYKMKSDARNGGVGYEGDIMTAEVFTGTSRRKFIPVLRRGTWTESAPEWLLGSIHIDLRGDPYSEESYNELLDTLHRTRELAPPIGERKPKKATAGPKTASKEKKYDKEKQRKKEPEESRHEISHLRIITEAIKSVPFVKYAIGIAGIAGAYTIINSIFELSLAEIVVVIPVLIVFMVILLVSSRIAAIRSKKAPNVVLWFSLIIGMIIVIFLVTSIFFGWPREFFDSGNYKSFISSISKMTSEAGSAQREKGIIKKKKPLPIKNEVYAHTSTPNSQKGKYKDASHAVSNAQTKPPITLFYWGMEIGKKILLRPEHIDKHQGTGCIELPLYFYNTSNSIRSIGNRATIITKGQYRNLDCRVDRSEPTSHLYTKQKITILNPRQLNPGEKTRTAQYYRICKCDNNRNKLSIKSDDIIDVEVRYLIGNHGEVTKKFKVIIGNI